MPLRSIYQSPQQAGVKERELLVYSVKKNLEDLSRKLVRPKNFKQFFWTPDYSFCGFGTKAEADQASSLWERQ